jgi:DNA-binding GntR family transcriptional regulator
MFIPKRQARETGRDYALRTLKQNIISLELAPGRMVSESDLAARMGLSRTPVREALLDLSKVRIVEIFPQRGSMISLIDYSMVEQARFIRNVLECAVVELLCQTVMPRQIDALRANLDAQAYALRRENADDLYDADNAFHSMLFDFTEKGQACDMIRWMSIHFDRVRSLSLRTVKDLKIVADHASVVDAIARRNAPEARRLMDEHLSRYRIDEKSLRESHPDYFIPVNGDART